MRRLYHYRYLILTGLAGTLLFVRTGCNLLTPGSNWMEKKYYQVRIGMTPKEVEDLLGEPNLKNEAEYKEWSSEFGVILVTFRDGQVSRKDYYPLYLNRAPRSGPVIDAGEKSRPSALRRNPVPV